MDLLENPQTGEARAEYVAWLEGFLPADHTQDFGRYRYDTGFRRRHQREAFEAGWLVPAWPVGLGGRGLTPEAAVAVRVEGALRNAPKLVSVQSVGVAAPALYDFGTPEQRDRHLVPTLRGDEDWCLGMSEPDAGSDFASLRTRAVLRDGVFVVDGSKTWTTQADESRWCLLYCRTDPEASKHRGISCLLVDMTTPGITVRPIRVANDRMDRFCEVFFDGVEVPAANLLGDLHGGWGVSLASLQHERDMIWVMNWVEIERARHRVDTAAASADRDDLRVEAGRLATDAAALRLTGLRVAAASAAGLESPEFHILKLLGSETLQRAWDLVAEAEGGAGLADADLTVDVLEALGATIYGGTSQVQRNILAERVLGLPR
jgi:alkylation response protein AidB-like acyl-CoA dehydrogenase